MNWRKGYQCTQIQGSNSTIQKPDRFRILMLHTISFSLHHREGPIKGQQIAVWRDDPHLDEADVLGVLAEALPADVEAVLADQTPVVSAHTAAYGTESPLSTGYCITRECLIGSTAENSTLCAFLCCVEIRVAALSLILLLQFPTLRSARR